MVSQKWASSCQKAYHLKITLAFMMTVQKMHNPHMIDILVGGCGQTDDITGFKKNRPRFSSSPYRKIVEHIPMYPQTTNDRHFWVVGTPDRTYISTPPPKARLG